MMQTFQWFKKTTLFIVLVFSLFNTKYSLAQILTYTNDTGGAYSSVISGATGTALSRVNGALTASSPCTHGYTTRAFTTATTYATTLPAIQISAAPISGNFLHVTGFSVGIRRSTNGPLAARLAYSTDGGTTWVNQGVDQAPNNAGCDSMYYATWASTFNVTYPNTLIFRIYSYNASSTLGNLQILNLNINGTDSVLLPPCSTPGSFAAGSITSSSATVSWGAVTGAISYMVGYRLTGSTTWTFVPATTTSLSLTGLASGSTYDYEVRSVCAAGDSSSWSATNNFTTLLPPCSVPTGISAGSITATSALVSWTGVTGAISYMVGYRISGTTTWTFLPSTTTSLSLTGLTYGTVYQYEVRAVCAATDSSTWSSTYTFTTPLPPCSVPTGITATSITPTSALLSWTAVTGAAGYVVGYRVSGTTIWTNIYSSATSITLSSLTPTTNYQYEVRTVCVPTDSSNWSSVNLFTTTSYPPCSAPTGITVGSITITSATVSWTAVTGAIGYVFSYQAASGTSWINTYTTTTSMALTGLVPATYYNYRIRTVCMVGDTSNWSGIARFTTLLPPCSTPSGMTVSSVTSYSATISWTPVMYASSYTFGYRITGTTAWTTISTTTASVSLYGLSSGTTYDYDLSTVCAPNDYSSWTTLSHFTTSGVHCTVPTGLNVTGVTASAATLNWTAVTGAIGYVVGYHVIGTTSWTDHYTTATSYSISGLLAGTVYNFDVRSVCAVGDSSAWSSVFGFSTSGGSGSGTVRSTNGSIHESSNTTSLVIAPNPTKDNFKIAYHLSETAPVTIIVSNSVGQTMSIISNGETQNEGDYESYFQPMQAGLYIVKVLIGTDLYIEKVVKM